LGGRIDENWNIRIRPTCCETPLRPSDTSGHLVFIRATVSVSLLFHTSINSTVRYSQDPSKLSLSVTLHALLGLRDQSSLATVYNPAGKRPRMCRPLWPQTDTLSCLTSTRNASLEVAPTTLVTFEPTLNFRLAVTYLKFPVHACFSAKVGHRSTCETFRPPVTLNFDLVPLVSAKVNCHAMVQKLLSGNRRRHPTKRSTCTTKVVDGNDGPSPISKQNRQYSTTQETDGTLG